MTDKHKKTKKVGKKAQESTAWKKLMLKPFFNKYPKRIVGHHTEPAPPAVHIPAIGAVLGPAPGPAPALASATTTATTPSKVIPIVSSG